MNTIISACAGAGKTFQLSNEYLGILFRGDSVDSILASTFTRKAAGEILDRILQRLADAALDEEKCRELIVHVPLPQSSDTMHPQQQLRATLAQLVKNLYRMRIGTLDSFFNKIATSFAPELALPPGWSILDDNDFVQYLNEAVRKVLTESERNDARKLMNLLQKGEQDRNITSELVNLALTLLPIVRESTSEAWDHSHILRPEIDATQLQDLLDRFNAADLPKNNDGSAPKNLVKTREQIVVQAMNEQWKEILEQTLVYNVAEGNFRYASKDIEGDLLASVKELTDVGKAVLVNKLVGQTKATRQLLELIIEAYDEIVQREGLFRFEDITERLARDDFSPTLESLSHRMDASTEHLFLDEFQDTSMSQWKVLKTFAQHASTAKSGSFFCVGDTKQAIYGWRGGVAEIFNTIEHEIDNVVQKPLNKNFRSSPVVIETVNDFFRSLGSNSALAAHPVAVKQWSKRFETHEAAKKNLPGFCVLEVVPKSQNEQRESDGESDAEEQDENQVFFEYTINRIIQLYQERPGVSIGVLVARNKQIGALIAGLKNRGIEASEEGGNPLTDSAAVLHVLSAMTLADHPGDLVARFHLASGPLAEYLRMTDFRSDNLAAACSLRLREKLQSKGYGLVVHDMLEQLAPSCNAREFQRLEKLMELAYQFQESATGTRTRRFVEMVRTTKVESPTASRIRIMTIHKSKGLEFDIVVLPDLDQKLVKRNPQIIVDRDGPTGPVRFVVRYAPKEVQIQLPSNYQSAFDRRIQGEVEESLSVLYVAMTRAVHELVMIVPALSKSAVQKYEKEKPTFSSKFSGVLRAAAMGLSGNMNPHEEVLYRRGNQAWFESVREQFTEKTFGPSVEPSAGQLGKQSSEHGQDIDSEPASLDCRLAERPQGSLRNLPRKSPSSMERFELDQRVEGVEHVVEEATEPVQMTEAGQTLWMDREDAQLRGTAIHACFEHSLKEFPWLDQVRPNPDTLKQAVLAVMCKQKGNIDPDTVVQSFLAACEKPNIRHALSKESYATSGEDQIFEVEHERRFAVRLSNYLLRGSVDRLVIRRKNGIIVGLDIIDYKTDRPRTGKDVEEFLGEHRAVYLPQMEAYREGMAQLYRLDRSKITAKLLFVELDRVVQVF